ncbi:hypothetical protein PC114_g22192 [Phytophthora cactorum]|nr:hypothetical protein PC114_g22192 [Phytophthora cactorum]
MAQRSPVADADPSERVRRPRLPWTLPWSTPVGSTVPHSSYTGTLPSRVLTKNNESRCNLTREHVARGELAIAAKMNTSYKSSVHFQHGVPPSLFAPDSTSS